MPEVKPFEIVVVDDEPPIYELLVRIASQLFPEATFINARSAQETLAHLGKQPSTLPQLILLDIDLGPSINGLDLIPQLQTLLKGKVPIIMFTSTATPPIIKQAYEQGAVAYTQKPTDLQGWKTYVAAMREYWYDTTILPTTA